MKESLNFLSFNAEEVDNLRISNDDLKKGWNIQNGIPEILIFECLVLTRMKVKIV